jgi:hypothetical protein
MSSVSFSFRVLLTLISCVECGGRIPACGCILYHAELSSWERAHILKPTIWSVTLTSLSRHSMDTLLFGKKGNASRGGSSWINSSRVHKLVCKKGEQGSCCLIGTRGIPS